MAEFLEPTQAKTYLCKKNLMKSAKSSIDFATLLRDEFYPLVEIIHPELSGYSSVEWVRGHLLQGDKINADFLPMLGDRLATYERMSIFENKPKLSLRTLAVEQGIDPDYAVSWAQQVAKKVFTYVTRNKTLMLNRHALGLPSGHLSETVLQGQRQRYVDAVYMKVAKNSEGKDDIQISGMMAQLLDFAYVAKSHKLEIERSDYGALTLEDMHAILQKPTLGNIEGPGPVVSKITRFRAPTAIVPSSSR